MDFLDQEPSSLMTLSISTRRCYEVWNNHLYASAPSNCGSAVHTMVVRGFLAGSMGSLGSFPQLQSWSLSFSISTPSAMAPDTASLLSRTQFDEEDVAALVIRHKNTLRTLHFEYSRMHYGTWRSLFETIRDSLQLEVLHLEYPIQGDERITFPFADIWCHHINVNDQDDDESRTMPEMLTELIEVLEVGFERDADPNTDTAYDSDDPGASSAAWERMRSGGNSDDGNLDSIFNEWEDGDE
ncbi:uncharacterized protein BDZ99DRAFT_569286 [Mytilinidion resinicola]|uniref:Uncharacterized protein n=1 Tax=Mytilinidion resinicola TaxID=574789 RepID=A0A6A6YV36_9PEZI|nr:uncharacterized protein BDZ99DRAFT_569286 [Mytilinidion resinicola]KAF2812641.1 hypothetical protein BDZ99DRAFT_569286 [Mytilinidion resinicola]